MLANFLEKLNIKLPPLPTAPPTHEPAKRTLIQLATLIAIALVLHFSFANTVIAVFSTAVFGLKCIGIWRNSKAPSQWLTLLLTISSIVMIIAFYGGWSGQTAGISFLVLLVSLKFLESKTVRDYFVVCIILYFLTASSFLFNSSLPSILMVVAYSIAITSVLFQITNPAPDKTTKTIISSSFLILKAIPLALFLFFFFPRITGDFGFLPSLDKQTSGLDDALVAGEMAASAFNNELAFQVSFDGDIPPNQDLYWRAKVMNKEINFNWEASSWIPKRDTINNQNNNSAANNPRRYDYTILHEPTVDLLLPYLDYVTTASKGKIGEEFTVALNSREQGTFSYTGSSSPARPIANTPPTLSHLLQTAKPPSAKVQALLGKINRENSTDMERALALFNYFQVSGFEYSLTPPALDEESPIDDFLFNTKEGYCEHYASAFSTLLRWMGIPSRIVVGYQGGELNSTGNFLEVRYSDAHAWSEALIENRWVRFDATAATSPERIEYGMSALLELWGGGYYESNNTAQGLSNFLNPSGGERAWRKVVETWSNVQYQWKKWVVDYDAQSQQELLQKLGLSAKNSLTTLVSILSIGVTLLLGLYFWQLLPKAQRLNDLQKLYKQYLKKLKRAGLVDPEALTPGEVAIKIKSMYPAQAKDISDITNKFNALNYGPEATEAPSLLEQLQKQISKLKLTKKTT